MMSFLSAFADDLQVSAIGDFLQVPISMIESEFTKLKLKLSIPKSFVSLTHSGPDHQQLDKVKLYNQALPTQRLVKYLGCYISQDVELMRETVWKEHVEWIHHIGNLPLTAQERIKLLNTVGIPRLVFRTAALVDLFEPPPLTSDDKAEKQLKRVDTHTKHLFYRAEKLHRDCILQVTGISGYSTEKTLYTPQPRGYGLRHAWIAMIGTAAVAYQKAITKDPTIAHLNTFSQVETQHLRTNSGSRRASTRG